MSTLDIIIAMVTALGGFELIKYLIEYRSNKKKAVAEANSSSTEADIKRNDLQERTFDKLQKQIDKLQEERDEQDARYNSQTQRLRETQDLLRVAEDEKNKQYRKIQDLIYEDKIFRCEVKRCANRRPPSYIIDEITKEELELRSKDK